MGSPRLSNSTNFFTRSACALGSGGGLAARKHICDAAALIEINDGLK
jgi:hypothetical protein